MFKLYYCMCSLCRRGQTPARPQPDPSQTPARLRPDSSQTPARLQQPSDSQITHLPHGQLSSPKPRKTDSCSVQSRCFSGFRPFSDRPKSNVIPIGLLQMCLSPEALATHRISKYRWCLLQRDTQRRRQIQSDGDHAATTLLLRRYHGNPCRRVC